MLIRSLVLIMLVASTSAFAGSEDVQLSAFEGNYVRVSGTGYVNGCSEKLELRVADGKDAKKLSFQRDGQEMFNIEPGKDDRSNDWEGLWSTTVWHHELSGTSLSIHSESWVGCVTPLLFCKKHYEGLISYTLNTDGSIVEVGKNTDSPEIDNTCTYQRTN